MESPVAVREVMNREYIGVSESDGLLETTELLVREDEPTALVLRGNEPIGVVSTTDVLAYLVSEGAPADASVSDAMTESIPSVSADTLVASARDDMAAQSTKWALVVENGEPLGTLTEHDILSSVRLESEMTDEARADGRLVSTGQTMAGDETAGQPESTVEEQGICSGCGTLTRSLASQNGQVLCADCRDV